MEVRVRVRVEVEVRVRARDDDDEDDDDDAGDDDDDYYYYFDIFRLPITSCRSLYMFNLQILVLRLLPNSPRISLLALQE